jgi:hypothetical protein
MAKFKKSRNPNGGSCERGTIQIDIESDNRDALEKMEKHIVDIIGIEPSCYEDETELGILFSLFVPTNELKNFNDAYKEAKLKFKNM